MSAFRFTDEEWRAYQQVPDQGYSHRAFLERIVNERLASRPVTDAEVERAAVMFGGVRTMAWDVAEDWEKEHVLRQMRLALEAAREVRA